VTKIDGQSRRENRRQEAQEPLTPNPRASDGDEQDYPSWVSQTFGRSLSNAPKIGKRLINAVARQLEYCEFLEQQGNKLGLFADDAYFGGGDFEANEFVGGVSHHCSLAPSV
jgi:hypothetical protein